MPQKQSKKLAARKVAVLLATHNGELFIKRQLETILHQKDVKIYLFISDDNSNDQTIDIIQSFITDGKSNIDIISTDKKFGSAARNFFHLIKNIDVSYFDYV